MDLWRYRELLPVRRAGNIASLGETATPIVALAATGKRLGLNTLLVKDEGRLPTGSFKARGLVMAVSMAKELGVTKIAMPTNGNAGRSEEHTSELQSLMRISYAVFCLKKKT